MSGVRGWGNLEDGPDPRVRAGALEYVGDSASGGICLVGVVHDHPASVARVRRVVGSLAPAVLALELPQPSVGLFESFARDDSPPSRTGEMSAAIRASPASRIVGIDAPSRPFLRALGSRLRRGTLERQSVRSLARRTTRLTAHAAACWGASVANRVSLPTPDVVPTVEYDCTPSDPPALQAEHEADHVRRSRSLLAAIEAPTGQAHFGELREAAMARRLRDIDTDGVIVAVVGFDHLEAIADRLRKEPPATRSGDGAAESRRR